MRANNVIRVEAMDALITALGTVETERFICMEKEIAVAAGATCLALMQKT